MDRKWFPDFVRVVDEFEFTQTQKILVRHLKADHFNRRAAARCRALLARARRRDLPALHAPRTTSRCASASRRRATADPRARVALRFRVTEPVATSYDLVTASAATAECELRSARERFARLAARELRIAPPRHVRCSCSGSLPARSSAGANTSEGQGMSGIFESETNRCGAARNSCGQVSRWPRSSTLRSAHRAKSDDARLRSLLRLGSGDDRASLRARSRAVPRSAARRTARSAEHLPEPGARADGVRPQGRGPSAT